MKPTINDFIGKEVTLHLPTATTTAGTTTAGTWRTETLKLVNADERWVYLEAVNGLTRIMPVTGGFYYLDLQAGIKAA